MNFELTERGPVTPAEHDHVSDQVIAEARVNVWARLRAAIPELPESGPVWNITHPRTRRAIERRLRE